MDPAIDVKDVSWIDPSGSEMTPEAWDNAETRCFGMLLDGRRQATGIKRRGSDTSLLMVFNAHHDTVKFALPPSYEAEGWRRLFDTADPQLAADQFSIGAVYEVTARSMLLFERVPERRDRQSGAVSAYAFSTRPTAPRTAED